MSKITGLLEKINKKVGETNGKEWTLYGYLINGAWYSTFKNWDAEEGSMVTIDFETDREGRKTIKNVELNQETFKGSQKQPLSVSSGTSIARQNALRHADALLASMDLSKMSEAQMLKKYFALAEMVEEWIQRPVGLSFSESSGDPDEEDVD